MFPMYKDVETKNTREIIDVSQNMCSSGYIFMLKGSLRIFFRKNNRILSAKIILALRWIENDKC